MKTFETIYDVLTCTAIASCDGGDETCRQNALLVLSNNGGELVERVVFGYEMPENDEDWKEMYANPWWESLGERVIVTDPDASDDLKKYIYRDSRRFCVRPEHIDAWYGNADPEEINAAQAIGLSMDDINGLSVGWDVPLEKLMEQVEEM